jgi:Tfp pilus assembly protein PilV
MKALRKKEGFMMIEVIIATSIIVVFILISMSVATKAITFSKLSFHNVQAVFLLEEGAEAIRINRDNAWANISGLTSGTVYYPTFSGGTWTFSTTPTQIDNFTRTIVMSNVNRNTTTGDISVSGVNDIGTKLFTITVSWLEGGQTISKNLKFYISDIFS